MRPLAAPAKGVPIPRSFFGMHIENAVPSAYNLYGSTPCPLFGDLGYGAVRLYESYATQMFCNPANGTFDWAPLDALVTAYTAAGVEIVYTFGNMPAWATGGSATHYNPLPPIDMASLTGYVSAVVARYAGRIGFYEIWNEMDNATGSWAGTVAQMQAVWAAVVPLVRAGDPSARVMTGNVEGFGSMNLGNGLGYQDLVLRGATGLADVLAVHTYCDPSQPEFVVRFGQFVAVQATKYGFASYVATESGALSWYDAAGVLHAPNSGGAKMPAAQASGWVTRLGLCHWLGGFARWYYFSLDGNGIMAWDMVDYSGTGAVASVAYAPAVAYKYLVATLAGACVFGFVVSGGVYACQFVQASGRRGSIYWTADYGGGVVNSAGAVKVTDNLGQALVASAAVAVGGQPVFVWWD